jgi:capsular polysaccharide biosynthesis protein
LAGIDVTDAWYVINHTDCAFQREGLEALGIPASRVIRDMGRLHIEADELIVPSVVNPCFNTDTVSYGKSSLEFVRRTFLSEDARSRKDTPPTRLFISREHSRRRIGNEAELSRFLHAEGFVNVILENHTVREQAALFDQAEIVVGFHGAGMTNVLFCRSGTKVVEIFNPDFIVNNYWPLCDQLGLRYFAYCEDDQAQGTQGHRFQRTATGTTDVARFSTFFREMVN